jgi:phage baseplate assembly protein W|tara:strand:- start:255 stop:668 length:414 start_codon:yes stop_codon:yes gene_type:complete
MISTPQRIDYLTTSKFSPIYGFEFPVVSGTGGFFTATQGLTSISSSLKQLILTNKGERVMMPQFGTSLRSSVFSHMDESRKTELISEIRSAIATYEPRVVLKNLSLDFNNTMHQLTVSISFSTIEDVSTTQIVELRV